MNNSQLKNDVWRLIQFPNGHLLGDNEEWSYFQGFLNEHFTYGHSLGWSYDINNDHWKCDRKGMIASSLISRLYGNGFETKELARENGNILSKTLGIEVRWHD